MSKKEELEKKKKIEALKQRRQEAIDEKRKNDLETKSTPELINEAESRWKKSSGRGFTPEERQGARTEIETGKKYKDISPLMSKGNFNRNTPKDGWGDTGITQDEQDRKKKRK